MNFYTTRLSVVLALLGFFGLSNLPSVASAQDLGEMNFEFADVEEFADFSPEAENAVAEEPPVRLSITTLVAGAIGVLVAIVLAIVGAWKAFTKARRKRREREHIISMRDRVSEDMQPAALADPARDVPMDRVA